MNHWIIAYSILIILGELIIITNNRNDKTLNLIYKYGLLSILVFGATYLYYYLKTSMEYKILIPFAIILSVIYIFKAINILYKSKKDNVKVDKIKIVEKYTRWFEALNITYAVLVLLFTINVM